MKVSCSREKSQSPKNVFKTQAFAFKFEYFILQQFLVIVKNIQCSRPFSQLENRGPNIFDSLNSCN